jgi:hypothetical protein
MHDNVGRGDRSLGLLLGGVLVVAGVVLLAAQMAGFDLVADLRRLGWPIFIILPGLVLLVIGLLVGSAPGVGMAVGGSIVTTVGLVLAYQSATGHWTSWTYAWALVGPTAAGAGMVLWSIFHRRADIFRGGLGPLAVGVTLFLIFFAFFEGVLGLGGDRGLATLGRQALPLILIAAGVMVIVVWLFGSGRRRAPGSGEPRGGPPA